MTVLGVQSIVHGKYFKSPLYHVLESPLHTVHYKFSKVLYIAALHHTFVIRALTFENFFCCQLGNGKWVHPESLEDIYRNAEGVRYIWLHGDSSHAHLVAVVDMLPCAGALLASARLDQGTMLLRMI